MKRDSNVEYYLRFFDDNIKKSSAIWQGIRSIVNINNTSRKDIKLLNDKGKNACDPTKIAEILNLYFVSVGHNIDKNIPNFLKSFTPGVRVTIPRLIHNGCFQTDSLKPGTRP